MADYGDIVVYADAGCRLSDKRFMNFLIKSLLDTREIELESTGHTHSSYTSNVVLKKLGSNFSEDRMIAATSFGMRKTKKTNDFINLWYDFCQNTDLLRDPERQLEPDTFIDHRHDQSLFSLCLYNFFPDLIQTQKSGLLSNAILPLRMRNGVLTDYNFKNFVSSLNNSTPLP